MDLIEYSNKLQKQAEQILENNNIFEILSKFGLVHAIGSFEYKLMYDPDIDLVVQTDDPRDASLKAMQLFLKDKKFNKFEYGDFVSYPRKDRPSGYIICLRKDIEGLIWEVEIWFLKDKINDVLENINISQEQKLRILEAKLKRDIEKKSKRELSSFEIYKNILKIK